jgi:hypothetical protein
MPSLDIVLLTSDKVALHEITIVRFWDSKWAQPEVFSSLWSGENEMKYPEINNVPAATKTAAAAAPENRIIRFFLDNPISPILQF